MTGVTEKENPTTEQVVITKKITELPEGTIRVIVNKISTRKKAYSLLRKFKNKDGDENSDASNKSVNNIYKLPVDPTAEDNKTPITVVNFNIEKGRQVICEVIKQEEVPVKE